MGRSFVGVLCTVVAVTALVGCGSSSSTTSSSTPAPQTSVSSVDGAAFASGLAWFFTDSSSTTPAVLPAALPSCTLGKLGGSDAALVAGLTNAKSADTMPDASGIRVFRASATCDHGAVQALFLQEENLAQIGVTAADQTTCLGASVVDNIVGVDDTKVTSTGGEVVAAPMAAALETCVPIKQALTTILSDPKTGISAAQVDCIATAASKTLTWAKLLDKSGQQAVKDAVATAAAGCKPS